MNFSVFFLFSGIILALTSTDLNAFSLSELLHGNPKPRTIQQETPAKKTLRLAKRSAGGSRSITGTIYQGDYNYSSVAVTVLDTFGYEAARQIIWFEGADSADFSITGLYAGSYCLKAEVSTIKTFYGNTTEISNASWLDLNSVQSAVANITLLEESGARSGVVIEGFCLENDTLRGGAIAFDFYSPFTYSSMYATAQIQQDGSYVCSTSVEPGSYIVKVSFLAPSYVSGNFYAQWWSGEPITAQPQQIDLSLSERRNFHFAPGAVIRGIVTDEISDTLQDGIIVAAVTEKGFVISSDYIWKEQSPEFQIARLPAGSYRLVAYPSIEEYRAGYYLPSYYDEASDFKQAEAIQVSGNSEYEGFIITLKRNPSFDDSRVTIPNATVSGTVTDTSGTAVPNARIDLFSARDNRFSMAYTNDLGFYQLRIESGMEFYLNASTKSPHCEYYLSPVWYEQAESRKTAVTLSLQNEETKTIDFTLKSGGSLGGFFKSSEALPENSEWPCIGIYAIKSDNSLIYYLQDTEISGFRGVGLEEGRYTAYLFPISKIQQPGVNFGLTKKEDIEISSRKTTVISPIQLQSATASISGTIYPSSEQGSVMHYVMVYNSDSLLACVDISGLLSGLDNPLGRLPEESFSTEPIQYKAGPLPAGTYALAHVSYLQNGISLDWHGGASSGTGWYDEDALIKPFIPPTASWITIESGEQLTGIHFGTSNKAAPQRRREGFPELRVTSRGELFRVDYQVSTLGKNQAKLDIVSLNGTIIRSYALQKKQGSILWNSRHHGKGSGIFLFRLSSEDQHVTLKHTILRQ